MFQWNISSSINLLFLKSVHSILGPVKPKQSCSSFALYWTTWSLYYTKWKSKIIVKSLVKCLTQAAWAELDGQTHSLIRGVLIQSCPAGAKNFTNYVFCHVQFSSVIQNIENCCAIEENFEKTDFYSIKLVILIIINIGK